jgi:hypothetical protein
VETLFQVWQQAATFSAGSKEEVKRQQAKVLGGIVRREDIVRERYTESCLRNISG